MEFRSGRAADVNGLEEEEETLLKDSDTQDSSLGGTCTTMFRSRHADHDKGAVGGRNKDVNIPLVRDRDSEEAATIKAVQAQENKRRKRRIMKFAVYIMFGVIALGVFAIWLFHKDSIDSIRFKSNFVFNVKVQTLEIKSNDQGLLYGELGRYLKASPFYSCWDPETEETEENCLHWKHMAYLRVTHDDNSTGSCYTLQWQGLHSDFLAEDCFYLQKYNWFGYLVPDKQFWPVSDVEVTLVPYYTHYPAQQKVNLVPSWFGSQGISIFVHSSFPFTVSWNDTEKRQFCLTSELKITKEIPEGEPGVNQLTYTICQGKNLKEVYDYAQEFRHNWEAELQKTFHTIQPLMWPILTLSSPADITALTEALRANRTKCSFLELPATWEREFGDMEFDEKRLSEVLSLIAVAEAGGCSVVLPISTFFTFNSKLFETGVKEKYFLRDELNLVTKMVRWQDREGAVLDTTNPGATQWYLSHIQKILASYNVHALKLLHIDVPRDANYYDTNMTFLDYSRLFYRDTSTLFNVTLILEQATGFVSEPVLVTLRTELNEVGDAQCFNTVVPWALSLGTGGYPLIVLDATNLHKISGLSREILERWLQLAIFFPALQIPNLPELSGHSMNQLLNFRRKDIIPYMQDEWAKDINAPIIRPLWWRDPLDVTAQMITDQFLVGNNLLVAPILCNGTQERKIYLPAGLWKDAEEQIIAGPRTIHINVEQNQIPFFWDVTEHDNIDIQNEETVH